jgi:hypothetical protein
MAFDEGDRGRQMDFVTRKPSLVAVGLASIGGLSRECAQRVEPLEFEAAVVAEQFVQTC